MDFAYLEGFAQGDRTVVSEVLALFAEQARLWTPKLDPSRSDLRETAHTIKGSARGIGAAALGDAAARVEAEGPEGLDELREALAAAVADVETYLAQARAP